MRIKWFVFTYRCISFQTDDCGVFKTSLSIEFRKLLSVVPLGLQEVRDLCLEAVSYAFAKDDEKDFLKKTIYDFWQNRM